MLAAKNYVPLLKTKPAEIEAYRQLSDECKHLIFPIFLIRPWQNGKHLSLTVRKILEATNGSTFGVGLDYEQRGAVNSRPAQSEFDALFNSSLGFRAFYDFVRSIEEAVPILQPTTDVDVMVRQLSNAVVLDRGLIVHQQRQSNIPITETILALPPLPNDTIFVVDAGWSKDLNLLESWASMQANRIFSTLPSAEIVVMSSSFPDGFAHIEGTAEEMAHEVHVYNAVRLRLQAADLTLGDWASTRLSQKGGGGRIPSRIDLARPSSWQIFRSPPDADNGFLPLAHTAMSHPVFTAIPDCMGKRLIAATDGDKAGITGTQKNTRARINMHMTIQSNASSSITLDEQPYVD